MEQLKKKFDELYNFIISSRDTGKMKMLGWVMKAMMYDMIDAHPQQAEEYLNILESVRWDNYLTEKEAEDQERQREEENFKEYLRQMEAASERELNRRKQAEKEVGANG